MDACVQWWEDEQCPEGLREAAHAEEDADLKGGETEPTQGWGRKEEDG